MSILRSGVDTYVLYTLVRRLATPFKDWKAYKLGVIDDKGKILIGKKDRTPEQYSSLTYLDIFAMNIKRVLQRIPGGNSRIATYGAALWLLKESKLDQSRLIEDDGGAAPTNTSSGGGLARSSEKEAKSLKIGKQTLKRLRKKR